uniref:Cytochrome P450 n=1 Tax=Panagrolaimus superbus TaxID=310955 RepID=A0A914YY45_9BILA
MLDEKNFDGQLLKLKKQYGSVMTLWLPNPNIIFSDHKIIKETFIRDGEKYAGRPVFNLMKMLMSGNYSLSFNEDSFWRSQRRFGLHVLRDFGVGRPILEETVINQAQDVCIYLKNLNKEPTDLHNVLTTSVGNIIYQLTFNRTTKLEDNLIIEMLNHSFIAFQIFNTFTGFLIELWEPFKYLNLAFGSAVKNSLAGNDKVINFLRNEIEEHRKDIDFNNEPRDYIDAFLIEQNKHNPNLINSGEWCDLQLIGSCYDLFTAGVETTTTTIQMMILFAIRNPDIQKKIHEEIDKVIDKGETITMSHQSQLPYFNAFMQEVQRITILLPLNLQHKVTEDVNIDGYHIPKGTTVIPQFQSVHMDGKVFADPNKFDPTRFLDEQNNFKKDEKVTPFSIGKRACLGESLARMELFLFGATYFQRFEFHPETKDCLPPLDFTVAFTKRPKAFKVKLIERLCN